MKFSEKVALWNKYSGNSKWYSLVYKKYPLFFIPVEIYETYDSSPANRIQLLYADAS